MPVLLPIAMTCRMSRMAAILLSDHRRNAILFAGVQAPMAMVRWAASG
jgi:hypothetical protein